MRGIQIEQYVEGPECLQVSELPDLAPGDDEYLIRVYASAANFFDILQARLKLLAFPWVAGVEFAGTVVSTPRNPSQPPKFQPGARVFGAAQGAFATKLCAKEATLLPVPAGWSFQEAAGLFITAPTSYGALIVRANVKRGDHVLFHAAAGGVGLAAVQVAKAFGATVIATASTPRKLQVTQAYGADHVLSYADSDWPAKVKALTPGQRGVDIVYDPVGLVDKSTKCTAWNGRILIVGFVAGNIEKVAMNKVLLKNISLVGIHWGAYAVNEKAMIPVVWKGIMQLVAEGKLKGTVYTDEEFVGLERIKDALKALGARGTWGKVVKIPEDDQSRL